MSFAYCYPTRVHRMALISSGGFGREVHPLLRALSLPGARRAPAGDMRPTLALLAWLARLLGLPAFAGLPEAHGSFNSCSQGWAVAGGERR